MTLIERVDFDEPVEPEETDVIEEGEQPLDAPPSPEETEDLP